MAELRSLSTALRTNRESRQGLLTEEAWTHFCFLLHPEPVPLWGPPTHLHTPPRWKPAADEHRLVWPVLQKAKIQSERLSASWKRGDDTGLLIFVANLCNF